MELKIKVDPSATLKQLEDLSARQFMIAWTTAVKQFAQAQAREKIGGDFGHEIGNHSILIDDQDPLKHSVYVGGDRFPKIMQDGRDGDENPGYVGNMQNSATAGFKYFDCKGISEITLKVRGYTGGAFEVRTSWDGEVLATLPVINSNVWEEYSAPVAIPDFTRGKWYMRDDIADCKYKLNR